MTVSSGSASTDRATRIGPVPRSARLVVVGRLVDAELGEAVRRHAGWAADRVQVHPSVPRGADIAAMVVVPTAPVTAEALDALPGLRVLATASAGYDHIDVAAARRRGVVVTRVVGNGALEVAEHAIASICALLRGLRGGDDQVRAGRWDPRTIGARRIAGTSLGLVGGGRIGAMVADRALALGMRVSVFTRSPARIAAGDGRITVASSLDELLATCEVLSLHAPLTADTVHLVDAAAIAAMPRGGYVVNTARGGLVDIAALRDGLVSGQLAGAALDVFEAEPLPMNHPALTLPRTIITPHAAWFSPVSAVWAFEVSGRAIGALLGRGAELPPDAQLVGGGQPLGDGEVAGGDTDDR